MSKMGNSLNIIKGRAVASFFKPMCKSITKNRAAQIISAVILCILTTKIACAAGATGTDLLASQQATVDSTFGASSSLVKWFYIAEIIMGIFLYIKTRSPLVFIGIVACIIFTRVAFSIAS